MIGIFFRNYSKSIIWYYYKRIVFVFLFYVQCFSKIDEICMQNNLFFCTKLNFSLFGFVSTKRYWPTRNSILKHLQTNFNCPIIHRKCVKHLNLHYTHFKPKFMTLFANVMGLVIEINWRIEFVMNVFMYAMNLWQGIPNID